MLQSVENEALRKTPRIPLFHRRNINENILNSIADALFNA